MANLVKEYVATFSDQEKRQIIKDYETLNEKGMIGDCLLRTKGEFLINEIGTNLPIVSFMNFIAVECYKFYAYKYLNNYKNDSTSWMDDLT